MKIEVDTTSHGWNLGNAQSLTIVATVSEILLEQVIGTSQCQVG
jgi:hypothetical protein